MSLGIITVVFGGYDNPNPIIKNHGFDRALFVTDDPNLRVRGWEMKVVDLGDLHPRLRSKVPKTLVSDYLGTDQSVWIDGSMKLVNPDFVNVVRGRLEKSDVVMWSHKASGRDDLYQEAEFCYDLPKYKDQPLREQVEAYRKSGYPEHYGLWQTGTLARNHTAQNEQFGKLWIANMLRWSYQDQVSFSYMAWRFDIIPDTWDDGSKPWWFNPWLKFTGHAREEK